jgi:DNA-binding protein Fis
MPDDICLSSLSPKTLQIGETGAFPLRTAGELYHSSDPASQSACGGHSSSGRSTLAGALLSECLEETIGPELRAREWSDNVAGLRAYLWSLVVKSHAEVERSREREELQKILKLVAEGREFSLKESLAHIEEAIVERALARSRGNQAKAARLLGLTDRTIRRQLHKIV